MSRNLVINDAGTLSLAVANPTTPATGGAVRAFGSVTGVAVTSEDSDGNTTVDLRPNVIWDMSVKAEDAAGNIAVAVGDKLFYTDSQTYLSKNASGAFFGYALEAISSGSTDTINVFKASAANYRGGKGFINLDLSSARILSTNAVQNTTEGGVPDGNTDPILARVNGATDIALRLNWAANSVVELQFAPVMLPPDVDDAGNLSVVLMIAKGSNTDTAAVVGVKIFQGVGDSNAGGNTAALAVSTLAKYTVTMAASDLGAYPSFLNVSIVPGAHANDAIYLYAAGIEYDRL